MIARALALSAALIAAVGAGPVRAATPVAPVMRPPHLTPDPSTPEAGIWGLSDKAEAHVKGSADLETDSALNAYVRGVVCKVATEYCADLRVYVLDRPVFNAAAAPNGYVEVNSGLLLRAETEDQLAFVLGHEVTHFARNHTLERWQSAKNTANVMMVLQLGVAVVAAGAMYSAAGSGAPGSTNTINSISQTAQAVNDLIYLAGLAAFFGFNREEESEADRLGFGRAASGGYHGGDSVDLWQDLVAETQASDFPTVRKSETRGSMFNTHPLTAERIAALQGLAGGSGGAPDMAARRAYRAHIRPHLGEWLKDDLRRRDYGQSLHLIDRLEAVGEDLGVLEFYRGEALRQRRHDGDPPLALAAYKTAVSRSDAPPAAWRELGDAAKKAGDAAAARQAFQDYLVHAPDAQDRWIVEASLKSMQPAGNP
ncbi:MAG: M48 family metallopeptidase [Phenylobacterium sp.]